MKFFVVEPFTLETSQGKVTLPAGKILELSQDQAARLLQAGFIAEVQSLAEMEQEYFFLLARFFSIDDDPPGISAEEAETALAGLDILFRELTRQGCKVPVHLPIERQRKVA